MNQIPYRKIIFILMSFSIMLGKEIQPKNKGSEEILKVYNKDGTYKDRTYYSLKGDRLIYYIDVPEGKSRLLNIYSRLAFSNQIKTIKPYKFKVIINGEESFIINHQLNKDPSVFSEDHLTHSYTSSGRDIILINEDGENRIEIVPMSNKLALVRLISKPFPSSRDLEFSTLKNLTSDTDEKEILKTKSDKNEEFHILYDKKNKNELSFNVKGPKLIKIISRGTLPSQSNEDEMTYYQFKVTPNKSEYNSKNGVTYHKSSLSSKFWSYRMPKENPYIVCRLRNTYIDVPEGNYEYSIRLIDSQDTPVLFRIKEQSK